MQYKVKQQFKGSPDGARVIEFAEGQLLDDTDPDFPASLAEVALAEKWVEPVAVKKAPAAESKPAKKKSGRK